MSTVCAVGVGCVVFMVNVVCGVLGVCCVWCEVFLVCVVCGVCGVRGDCCV